MLTINYNNSNVDNNSDIYVVRSLMDLTINGLWLNVIDKGLLSVQFLFLSTDFKNS